MSEDHQLQQDVLSELKADPRIIPAHIGVRVRDGVATLTGHVETLPEKRFAENAAARVKGLKAIANEIGIHLCSVCNRTDDEIATAAINHLSWTTLVPQNAIQVMVDKGWVTLNGIVQSVHQKDAAEDNVHQLYGVVGVTNEIDIEPLSRPPE